MFVELGEKPLTPCPRPIPAEPSFRGSGMKDPKYDMYDIVNWGPYEASVLDFPLFVGGEYVYAISVRPTGDVVTCVAEEDLELAPPLLSAKGWRRRGS